MIKSFNGDTIAYYLECVLEFQRELNILKLLEKKSFFLFGPRSTGKTSLALKQLSDSAAFIDLLDGTTFLRLSADPSQLERMLESSSLKNKIIVIDEIQKVPELLNQVHRMIEKYKTKFLLTGSSARKLRRGGVNLLAGRAWEANLFPLVSHEIPRFDLEKVLRIGSLPHVYLSDHPQEELSAYVDTYLRQEILAEGLIRKIPPFTRFLKVAALSNSQLLVYSSIASDCGVAATTVREYFSILEDTLIGFSLEPFIASKKRKAIETAKFYFFDIGVTHTLAGTQFVDRNSDLYGRSFEQWVGLEIRAYISYRRLKLPLMFWRSVNGQEVDFLIGDKVAIEVKASEKITNHDLRGLKALHEENIFKKFYLISNDPINQKIDGYVECLHWKAFIKKLWKDEVM